MLLCIYVCFQGENYFCCNLEPDKEEAVDDPEGRDNTFGIERQGTAP